MNIFSSKLIQLFQTFKAEELRALKKWVRSPYVNNRKDVIALFDLLRYTKDFSTLSYASIASKIYPKTPFDAQQVRHLLSFLLKTLERYLILKEAETNSSLEELLLIRAYQKRHLQKPLQQHIKKLNKTIEQVPAYALQKYFYQNQLTLENYYALKEQVRNADMNLQVLSDSLDTFYISNKLYQACILKTHEYGTNQTYDHGLLNTILSYLEDPKNMLLQNQPSIAPYYHGIQTLISKDGEIHFQALKTLLKQTTNSQFNKEELKNLYFMTINYGIKRLKQNNPLHIEELFDLYKEALNKGLLVEQNLISQFPFKNIVALGLRLEAYDWTEQFIKKYSVFLEVANQANNLNYNLAKFNFERGKFKETLNLLQLVKYPGILPNLTAKVLQLKALYELDSIDVLHHYMRNFEQVLKRQTKIGMYKELYLNLVKVFKRLININIHDTDALKALEEMIKTTQGLPEQRWLLKKVSTMNK